MIWPVLLLLVAGCSASWLAYGLDPAVARHFDAAQLGGLHLVILSRQIQWLLLVGSVVPCLVLVGRVALNKTKSFWLIGLSVVVAMLFVRFSPAQTRPVRVLDGPTMPTLSETRTLLDEEFVVGLQLEGVAYAFPYRSLLRTPIVQLTDYDRRIVLINSPYANSATALDTTREMRADDLEYVAAPANSTLVYDHKYGQFIVGITGLTEKGQTPTGVRGQLPVDRMRLSEWRKLHPLTRIMLPTEADMQLPGVPLAPEFPMALADTSLPPETQIILLHTDPPAALPQADFAGPMLVKAGDAPLVLWRVGSELRAFHRVVDKDLFLTFSLKKNHSGKIKLLDGQTQSQWTYDGNCTDGPLKGKKMAAVRVEENVYWGVSKTWWPELKLIRPAG